MTAPDNQAQAQLEAIARAKDELRAVDLPARLRDLGLAGPDPSGRAPVRLFGRDLALDLASLELLPLAGREPASRTETILLLHYLRCPLPLGPEAETGEPIAFRELPGGQFYLGPFRKRTVEPLARRIGGDLDRLRAGLARFDCQAQPFGDFSARVHCFGRVAVTLVYSLPDEEFPALAEALFSPSVRTVFNAEDAAALAGVVCWAV